MSGHFDFGHDLDKPVGRVTNAFAHLLPGVIPSVRLRVLLGTPVLGRPQVGAVAPGTPAGQFRILPDFDPPPLILGQMPLQAIQLVHRHQVDNRLDLLGTEKVPSRVEQQRPVTDAGLIADFDHGQIDRPGLFSPQGGLRQ